MTGVKEKDGIVSTENVVGISLLDVLISEKNKTMKELGKYIIELKVLERADPDLVVAEDVKSTDSKGQPTAYTEVKASEMIERYDGQVKGKKMRLECVDILIAEARKK